MKKFVKQGLSLLLALAMVLSFVPMSVASAAVSEKATITIENNTVDIADVSAGGTKLVVVPVKIEQNVGFAAMDLTFSWPKGWSISSFYRFSGQTYDIFHEYDDMMGAWVSNAKYEWNAANGKWLVANTTDCDKNGYLCWMIIQVPGGIANGEYPITVSMTSSKKAEVSGVDINDQFDLVDGTIKVTGGVDLSVDVTTETTEYTYPAGTVSPLTATVNGADSDSATYQWYWYMQGSDATQATAIAGATSATYTPELTTFGTTTYYCVATVQEMELESNKIAITYNPAQLPEIKLNTTTPYTYNATEQTPPTYTVKTADGTELVKGTDYEETTPLTAKTNAGKYDLVLEGIGNYKGTQTATWTIEPAQLTLTSNTVSVRKGGGPVDLPKAKLCEGDDGYELNYEYSITSGAAYIDLDKTTGKVSAKDNAPDKAEATVSVTITDAKGNYVQEKPETVTVTVSSKDNVSDKLTFTAKDGSQAATTTYTESGIKLSDLVNEATFGGTAVGTGKISYSYKQADDPTATPIEDLTAVQKLNAGTYTITATYEDDSQIGSQSVTLKVTPMEVTVEVTLDTESLPFNNEKQTPKVTVTASNKELVLNTDYTVTAEDDVNVGEKTLTVSPMGNYTFTPVTKNFEIVKGKISEVESATVTPVYNVSGAQSTAIRIRRNAQIEEVTVGELSGMTSIISGTPTAQPDNKDGNDFDSVIVSYNLAGMDTFAEDMSVTIPLTISMKNYEDVKVSLVINLIDETIRVPEVSAKDIEVTYSGIPLDASYISGTATYEGEVVPGSWAWKSNVAEMVNAGIYYSAVVRFVPTDAERYEPQDAEITVYVRKATPSVEVKHDPLSSTNRTLADAHLSVGSSSTPGSVAWDLPTTTTARSGVAYKWTFTPYDTANYNSVTGQAILYTGSDSDTSYPVIIGGGGGTTTTQRPNGGTPNNKGDDDNPTPSPTPTPTPPVPEPVVIKPEVTVSNGTATANVSSADIQDAIDKLSGSKNAGIVIEPAVTGSVSKTEVSLPADAVNAIANNTKSALTVKTPQANFTVSNSGLAQLGKQGSSIVLSAEQLTDRSGTGVDLQVKTGSTLVENVTGGIQLEIPTKCGPGYAAVLVNDAGEVLGVVRKGYANDAGTSMNVPLAGSAKVVVTENAKTFDDVAEKDWSFDAIAFASSHELMRGIDDSHFAPDAQMTRAMLAVVLHNLENNPDAAQAANFSDVANDTWYTQAIQWAADKGIVKGYDSGAFGIDDPITREQIIVMLYRYAGSPKSTGNALNKFSDADRISDWAQDAMLWAVSNGILNGTDTGELAPQGTATREQVAQLLMNFVCSGLA